MKINKKILKQIISEEIEKMLSEEEVNEILPFLRRRKQRQARTQTPRKSAGTPDRSRRTPVPEPKPEPTPAPAPRGETRKIKTISFTKDIMPELKDDLPIPDRRKLSLLYKKLKQAGLIGVEISTGNKQDHRKKMQILRKAYNVADEKYNKEKKARLSQLSTIANDFKKFKTKEEAEKIIRQAADEVMFPDQVLRYLIGMLGDDTRIVESVIKRIVLENLKGNKVVL